MRLPISLSAALVLSLAAVGSASAAVPSHIAFGEGLKGHKLIHRTSSIPKSKNLAWKVALPKLSTRRLTLRLTQVGGPGPHPRVVKSWKVLLGKSTHVVSGLLTASQLKAMKLSPAVFRMDYIAGKSVIASGSWQRLNCANCGGTSGTY